ncbi:hypothetical protein F5890DRAFT_1479387 [Lentinula detonsa]|uniref:Uncharacterized protein n=1 Tax=Lentinula detonsa TaxID=2804962 RepID=A0AA38PN48_9AGAR|nr:hypothetical protein F5890DRAFT_1479387 [Lentinula detonsa]
MVNVTRTRIRKTAQNMDLSHTRVVNIPPANTLRLVMCRPGFGLEALGFGLEKTKPGPSGTAPAWLGLALAQAGAFRSPQKPRLKPQLTALKIQSRAKSPDKPSITARLLTAWLGLAWLGPRLSGRAGTSLIAVSKDGDEPLLSTSAKSEMYKRYPPPRAV